MSSGNDWNSQRASQRQTCCIYELVSGMALKVSCGLVGFTSSVEDSFIENSQC